MRAFKSYLSDLEELVTLLAGVRSRQEPHLSSRIRAALNGGPTTALRQAVSLSRIRASGAFFTGSSLAKRALRPILRRRLIGSELCDPACGVGDLLLARAHALPLGRDLAATLRQWGKVLAGFDV